MPVCTECQTPVSLPSDSVEGEIHACSSCGVELEVVGSNPFELALAPEVEEDWGE